MAKPSIVSKISVVVTAAVLLAGPLAVVAVGETVVTGPQGVKAAEPAVDDVLSEEEVECLLRTRKSQRRGPTPAERPTREEICKAEAALEKAGVPVRRAKAAVLGRLPADEGSDTTGDRRGDRRVRPASGGSATAVEGEPQGHGRRTSTDRGPVAFNGDGPVTPGLRVRSTLTLQPFATPVVSVPPVYDLAQVAAGFLTGGEIAAPRAANAAAVLATSLPVGGLPRTATDTTVPAGLVVAASALVLLLGAAHARRVAQPA